MRPAQESYKRRNTREQEIYANVWTLVKIMKMQIKIF